MDTMLEMSNYADKNMVIFTQQKRNGKTQIVGTRVKDFAKNLLGIEY